MLFVIDAQLPPSLADALRAAGADAVHVADLDLLAARDREIWDAAVSRSAVLVTKDRDFALLRVTREAGPVVLWVRTGNTDNRTLIGRIIGSLPLINDAITRGEVIIELVGR